MPRVNIYIPVGLEMDIRTSPHEINISRVCAAAIRAELAARNNERFAPSPFRPFNPERQRVERGLMSRYQLKDAVSCELHGGTPRDVVSKRTAEVLDRMFADGVDVAFGGGLQVWSIIRSLTPRNLALDMWAIGFGHVDHAIPHAHSNALVTLLSLLYAPRSTAHLVGAARFRQRWHNPVLYPPGEARVRRIVVGSCAPFDADSPYAQLLGKDITDFLVEENVVGDFMGVFITPDGKLIEPYAPQMVVSHIPSSDLHGLSQRDDTIVLLVSAGLHKMRLARSVLEAGLCNALITDAETARALVAR